MAGVDVSGLTSGEARSLLERKSRDLANDPAVFTAEGKTWRVRPNSVVVDVVDFGAQRSRPRSVRVRGSGRSGASSTSAYASSAAKWPQRAGSTSPRSRPTSHALHASSIGPASNRRSGSRATRPRPSRAAAVKSSIARRPRRSSSQALRASPRAGSAAAQDRPHARDDARPRRRRGQGAGQHRALGAGRHRLRPGRLASQPAKDLQVARASEERGDRSPARGAARQTVLREPPQAGGGHAPRTHTIRHRLREHRSLSSPRRQGASSMSKPRRATSWRRSSRRRTRKGDLAVVTARVQPERTTRDAKAMGITGLVGALRDLLRRRGEPMHNVHSSRG